MRHLSTTLHTVIQASITIQRNSQTIQLTSQRVAFTAASATAEHQVCSITSSSSSSSKWQL